ncbi:MAG: SDR family NAD(P)-dependent oxidoreductase [Alphaproteobacteria bacterium]|nr:SDR family NAD(P)-dependent oxidoreductase [Alphaproteobacteria bacterium]
MAEQEIAVIVGAGSGLSGSLARLFASEGMSVAMAARDAGKLAPICEETGARAYSCDAADGDQVDQLFDAVASDLGTPDIVVYNASARARGPITEVDREAVKTAVMVSCYAGFLVGQKAAQLMLPRGSGTILFTGASASVKGYPQSAPFAMGKFGLRGLAQAMARELSPQNIHVGHFVIDGGISKGPDDPRTTRSLSDGQDGQVTDSLLDPDAIARSYLDLHRQHRSAWTWEVELRPWVEKF